MRTNSSAYSIGKASRSKSIAFNITDPKDPSTSNPDPSSYFRSNDRINPADGGKKEPSWK